MILDCGTLSISYAVNGLATLSFTVYTSDTTPPYTEAISLSIGNKTFTGYVTGMDMVAASDTVFNEWKVTATVTSN